MRPLWTCPECGRRFVNANSWHSCQSTPVEHLFVGKGRARELFDAFVAAVAANGPVDVDTTLTGLVLMTRVRFAGAKPRRDRLRVAFWLRRQVESPRVVRTEFIPPDNWIHEVDVRDPLDLDPELVAWLREAYLIGQQRHPAQARYRARPG
jgi:hypothetical protein